MTMHGARTGPSQGGVADHDQFTDAEIKGSCALVCVDPPEPFESPASWISRLAFSQYASVREICNLLDIQTTSDPDMAFTELDMSVVARKCGLDRSAFAFMSHMFRQLRKIDRSGEDFLLRDGPHAAYRFCPDCLREQRCQHFPVHWRFKAWRWCPLHSKLLFDACPFCSSAVRLPMDLMRAISKNHLAPFMGYCQSCGANLTSQAQESLPNSTMRNLNRNEYYKLMNGRSLLAALWRGNFSLLGKEEVFPLERFDWQVGIQHLAHGKLVYVREE